MQPMSAKINQDELIDCIKALEHLYKCSCCHSHIRAVYENPKTEEKFELVFKKINDTLTFQNGVSLSPFTLNGT